MKLVHDIESQKKEEGDDKRKVPRLPLAEKIVAGAALLTVTFAVPTCTFVSNGLDMPDADQVDASDGSPDADFDGGHDADVDVDDGGPDADIDDGGHDGGPDADIDDGGMDGGPDADLDGGPDADIDDGGMDGGPDADVDAGPVVCAVATTGDFSGLIPVGTPRNVGNYIFDYLGPSGTGGALMDVTCGGMSRYDNYDFPEDVVTTLTITIDGKKLVVTPHTNGAAQTDITISVQNL